MSNFKVWLIKTKTKTNLHKFDSSQQMHSTQRTF